MRLSSISFHQCPADMPTQIIFQCPVCQSRRSDLPEGDAGAVHCDGCGWSRDEGPADFVDGCLTRCRICGCQDLWRQKDFPPALGLAIVAIAGITSCVAWAWYRPLVAIGILMAAALIDMVLYLFMGDMLVCYRCGARHRRTQIQEQHPAFDLEIQERSRQQQRRGA
jgi:hypothetical protein